MLSKWTVGFLRMARECGRMSRDPSTKVGAVVVDDHKRIVGMGFNGFARGVQDTPERYADKPLKHSLIVHAEINAVLNAATTEGCTLYSTFFPCPTCAGIIIQKGITRVVALTNPKDAEWADRQALSMMQFDEAGVKYQTITPETLDSYPEEV